MSDIYDIEALRKRYLEKTQSTKELKDFAASQQTLIEQLINQNQTLRDKLTALESVVAFTGGAQSIMSEEEIICVEQIRRLKAKSFERELTLDEVKRLDILVKNLRLIRGQSTDAIDHKDYSEVKEAELVAIATGRQTE